MAGASLVEQSLTSIGEHVRSWRLLWGWSQDLVAQRANISIATLRRIEQGDPGVKIGSFFAVLNVLNALKYVEDDLDPLNHEIGRMRAGMLDRQRGLRRAT